MQFEPTTFSLGHMSCFSNQGPWGCPAGPFRRPQAGTTGAARVLLLPATLGQCARQCLGLSRSWGLSCGRYEDVGVVIV